MANFNSAANGAPAFGRRGAPVAARVAAKQTFDAVPDYAAAKAALSSGKLPPWTRNGPTAIVVWSLLVLVLVGVMTYAYGGDLVRDTRLAGTWAPAPDLRAVDGHCTSYEYIVTLCDATILGADTETVRFQQNRFMMAFSSGGGEFLVPVRSTKDPEAISIGYAARDKLFNRVVTFVLAFVILVAGAISGARRLVAGRYKGGAAHLALMAGVVAIAGPPDAA
jgi:hypothetical protein